MNYPFSAEEFINVIANYNTSIWPAQLLLYFLGIFVIYLVARATINSHKLISIILAFFWLWMGIVYHLLFFSSINPVALFFGMVFIFEALLFLYFGVFKGKLTYQFNKSFRTYTAIFLMVIALLIYPLIGLLLGHAYPYSPTFGLPCPTTIFTFGVILLSTGLSKRLVIIPFLWSIIGFMAAISFGIKEDILLLISGIITLIVIFLRRQAEIN